MGRITIFTSEGCSASIRTMAALKKCKLPFIDINLTDHPSKRSDVLKLCQRHSTPQVFFNTRYIGGFEATIALLNEWALSCEGTNDNCSLTGSSTVSSYSLGSGQGKGSKTSLRSGEGKENKKSKNTVEGKESKASKNKTQTILYASMHDRYMAEIGDHHDPSDPRLAFPSKVVNGKQDAFKRDEEKQFVITLPNEDRSTVLEITVMLLDVIRHVDHMVGSTTYKHTFTGRDFYKAVCAVFEISTDEAKKFCGDLLSIGIFNVMGNTSHESKEAVYRMKCLETPNILNSFCFWTEKVDQNYMRLIIRLTSILNTIQMESTDRYGTMRRERAIKHSDFPMFEEAICELQGVHLTQLNDSTKIAFGINLYNLMMQYAILKIGAPDPKVKYSRVEYLTDIKFNVGGYLYSLYEWEHGILRGNFKGSSCDGMLPSSSVPFSRKDPRLLFCVTNPDPRIHFAINHGTNSCPSVRLYSATNLDEELTIATKAFCEKTSNLRFCETKQELYISKIFIWYRTDFVSDAKLLPGWIYNFTSGSMQQQLDSVFANKNGGKSIKVIENPFDWTMRSSWVYGVLPFELENFKMNKGRSPISAFISKSSTIKSQEIRAEL